MAMCQAGRAAALAVTLAATAFNANAEDGDIATGHAFAREACKVCHMVEAEEGSSRMIVIGPAFREIANAPGMTATAISVFLTSSHPRMPNLILTPEEITDVSAYILSLRDHP
jgi:mono/diheme cytochrome c family protein